MARIIINPDVFEDKRDAKCVAWNEAFRVVMEQMQFNPASEPTDVQRKFFSDTDYANDETMLRRTILARICTFDTSVEDPTDSQLDEAVEFLDSLMKAGAPQSDEEQATVQRIRDIISRVPRQGEPVSPQTPRAEAEPSAEPRPAEQSAEPVPSTTE